MLADLQAPLRPPRGCAAVDTTGVGCRSVMEIVSSTINLVNASFVLSRESVGQVPRDSRHRCEWPDGALPPHTLSPKVSFLNALGLVQSLIWFWTAA